MGDPGSGGWNRTGRGTVEEHPALEAGRLRRAGALKDGCGWHRDAIRLAEVTILGGRERLRVRHRGRAGEGDPQPTEEAIAVRWRACPFGGERPFLLCPGCRRPVLKLHLAAARFRCRRCHRLTHAACREQEHQRALRRAGRLRRRLDAGPAGSPVPPRPKGMHRRTHQRLACRIAALEAAADDQAALLVLRLAERLGRKSSWSFW